MMELPPLPEPACPRTYHCNKCGYVGETGPNHVRYGNPAECQYTATSGEPYWSEVQVRSIVAAAIAEERETCALSVLSTPPHQWVDGSDQWGNPCPAKIVTTRTDYAAAIRARPAPRTQEG